MRNLVASLSCGLLVSCTAAHQGPPVDLSALTVPTVVREAAKAQAAAVPPAPQPVSQGAIKAWTPPVVAPNGDRQDGHYVVVSRLAPKDERTPPPYVIPTAPKVLARPQPKKPPPVAASPTPAALHEPSPAPREPMHVGPERLPFAVPQEGPYVQPLP